MIQVDAIFDSPYKSQYANKEVLWLPMDTEELYKKHLRRPGKKELLIKYNWIDSIITYKFNKYGFRCQDFSNVPAILFLGCSLTVGIGLNLEYTWPTLVSNNLRLACYNLGVGGSSNDTAFRLCLGWLQKIRPIICVFCQTYDHRIELTNIQNNEFKTEWEADKSNGYLNKLRNLHAIKYICLELGIKFIAVSIHDIEYIDLGRDLYHPGIQSNEKMAQHVLSKI